MVEDGEEDVVLDHVKGLAEIQKYCLGWDAVIISQGDFFEELKKVGEAGSCCTESMLGRVKEAMGV